MLLERERSTCAGEMPAVLPPIEAKMPVRQAVLRLRDSPGSLDCWVIYPEKRSQRPAILTIHGIKREAKLQARLLAPNANRAGQVVVAPIFCKSEWPRYQQAAKKGRADLALLSLLRGLRDEGSINDRPIQLSGFSGGAQFAHRFAMLHPQEITSLTISSAGWYSFPDREPYPYGLGRTDDHDVAARMSANLERFLALPITVCCGSRDNKRDRNTRTGIKIDAQQGRTRKERAVNYVRALKERALGLGIVPNIGYRELPDVGHDFTVCVKRGGLDHVIVARDKV